jgi:hypothetical protein
MSLFSGIGVFDPKFGEVESLSGSSDESTSIPSGFLSESARISLLMASKIESTAMNPPVLPTPALQ